ncbi:MAG: sugar ABC transporter ATP-binding protein [Lachnospiraceae bacterium]|nr:sugar ABC transporter ATP-binding protein [Lachnospiraceae bacterium]
MSEEIILKLEGITKLFPGVRALDKVDLELRKGEVHAVIGENGAGKSTLMKVLLGIHAAEEGTITYKGKEVRFKSPLDALGAGIAMIHQEISLVPTMDVAENIWLGREKQTMKNGMINKANRYKKTEEILRQMDIDLDPRMMVKDLSVAQMQMVELVRAASYNADVIIMDEPTSALANEEIETLYRIVRDLKKQQVSIIFISHKLEEIFEICDRVSVYRDGHYVSTNNCSDITQPELVRMIVGREITDQFPKQPAKIGEVVLEVKNFSRLGVFKNVNFSVRKGEILGISGLVGAGRTEIMRALFGADPKDSGEIYIDGKEVKIRSPKEAIQNGISMLTEDRMRSGSIYTMSVKGNTTIAAFRKLCCNAVGVINSKKETEAFESTRGNLEVKCSSEKQLIKDLSGGNQQKVLVGRWLLTSPKVLIVDEPTRGIDVGSKSEIHRLISELAGRGMAVIMISSELPEILGMSDRILVVRHGKIVYECDRKDADQETLITHAFGAAKAEHAS